MASITEIPRITQPIALRRLPDPDYVHHPAYGLLFGRPKASARIRALARLWPFLRAQIPLAGQRNPSPRGTSGRGGPLYERVLRDGAVSVRLTVDEITTLRELVRPLIRTLQEKKAGVAPETRVFKDMILPLSTKNAPEFINSLRAALDRHGVLTAASDYLGAPVVMRDSLKLQITDRDDAPWHSHFSDVGLPDPATSYMHIDSEVRFMKGMLYLNEVTPSNGPFAYVLGSHAVRLSAFEYMVRKANDKSGLDLCDAATRELFWALPRFLRKKSEFGNDLLDASPEAAALIAHEHRFTTEDGHFVLFDNNGAHRGMHVVEGERHAVQIQLRPEGVG